MMVKYRIDSFDSDGYEEFDGLDLTGTEVRYLRMIREAEADRDDYGALDPR